MNAAVPPGLVMETRAPPAWRLPDGNSARRGQATRPTCRAGMSAPLSRLGQAGAAPAGSSGARRTAGQGIRRAAPPLLDPLPDQHLTGAGIAAQPRGLPPQRLIRLALGEAFEEPGHLGQQVGPLADLAVPLGLEAVPEVLLHSSTAERFTRYAPGLSPVARRTLRTNLRFTGRRVVPQLYPYALRETCPLARMP